MSQQANKIPHLRVFKIIQKGANRKEPTNKVEDKQNTPMNLYILTLRHTSQSRIHGSNLCMKK